MFGQAKVVHTQAITTLAIMALVKTMGSKRFVKAIDRKEVVPKTLIKNLNETMGTCTELGLEIPADLQAQALHYSNISKDEKEKADQ